MSALDWFSLAPLGQLHGNSPPAAHQVAAFATAAAGCRLLRSLNEHFLASSGADDNLRRSSRRLIAFCATRNLLSATDLRLHSSIAPQLPSWQLQQHWIASLQFLCAHAEKKISKKFVFFGQLHSIACSVDLRWARDTIFILILILNYKMGTCCKKACE